MDNWQIIAMVAKEQRQDYLRQAEQQRLLQNQEHPNWIESGRATMSLLAVLLTGSLVAAILWQIV